MKIKIVFFYLSVLGFCSCQPVSNEKSKIEISSDQKTEWIDLLEGDDLNQWEMYSEEALKGWEIVNGELHSSGAGWDANEDIITKQSFSNFELDLEWKISPGNSSGIFFYVQKGKDHPIYEEAPEYQVMDDKGWPEEMKPNQYTSASYAMYAAEGAEVKPVGEWNSTKIIVKYPLVQHWLNGLMTVEYEVGSADWKERKA